ncbi:contact-dependent growth inhibition system immunity protein [Halomonas sp. LR3S48]|uniref:contact-dependent growth inhibition system immunity protein n=1 Tax=Halomonas sp. LR3S48 TaxID=2982694 RepID=UPI0021E4B7EF|nr:contact-dependent growth inhibition system immunity protein [Halomonas sp. LR3S48]UYG03996.1 contact-dependent growth inhibition system immunity protein [Halomonas sp. LR3S48]
MNVVVKKSWAHSYMNDEFVQVETCSGYRGGYPDPEGRRLQLSPKASDDEMGEALLRALARSRFIHPDEDRSFFDIRGRVVPQYQEWVKEMMDRYGYKTKRAMFKNMKSCSVESHDGRITIRPSHHEKLEAWSGDGISESDYVVIPAASSPTEVGAALRLAFSRCT